MYQGSDRKQIMQLEAVTGFLLNLVTVATDIIASPWYKRQGKTCWTRTRLHQKHLYIKVPTADLEENNPGLPDEVALALRMKK